MPILISIGDDTMSNIEIYDILGNLVYSKQIVNQTCYKTVNLQSFTNGIYILKLSNNKYSKQTRLLINR
jgi:hypothetical protein